MFYSTLSLISWEHHIYLPSLSSQHLFKLRLTEILFESSPLSPTSEELSPPRSPSAPPPKKSPFTHCIQHFSICVQCRSYCSLWEHNSSVIFSAFARACMIYICSTFIRSLVSMSPFKTYIGTIIKNKLCMYINVMCEIVLTQYIDVGHFRHRNYICAITTGEVL